VITAITISFAKPGHEGESKSDLDKDERIRDATEASNVVPNEPRAEKDNAGLRPEIVGGDSATENCGAADRISDDEANHNGPKNIFDVGSTR